MAEKYRVGVIGRTGRGDYGHGLDVVWNEIGNTDVVAVADEDETGRKEASGRLNAEHAYADYREMLEKEKLDIVTVAPRWVDCHKEMTLAAVEAGCHVYLEKPMARSLDEADEIVAAVERKHVKFIMSHQTRYSPRLDVVKDLLAEDKLGDILEMRGRGKEDHRGGGEDLMVLGTHIMDLMRFLKGEPTSCCARVLSKGKPVTRDDVREGNEGIGPLAGDEIHASYAFASPTMGYFSTHRAKHGAGQRFSLALYGTKGIITIGHGSLPDAWFIEDPTWAPGVSKAKWIEISSEGLGKPEPLSDITHHPANIRTAKDLIHAIETDTVPSSNVYEARGALEMILAVYESHRLAASVSMPLKNRKHPLTLL